MNALNFLIQFTFLLLKTLNISAQGCANTCPPLNDIGVPQDSLCEGNLTDVRDTTQVFQTCFGKIHSFKLSDFKGKGRVTVVSNYYFGCNAGRRESGVFAHIAQRLYEQYPDRVMFIASNKGASCKTWSKIMANDAFAYYPGYTKPIDMPAVMDDADSILRDLFFTPPFGHPSYVVLDGNLRVRHKFIGPCCGKRGFTDCRIDEAKSLNDELTKFVESILHEDDDTNVPTLSPPPTSPKTAPTSSPRTPTAEPTTTDPGICEVGQWSDWSGCSTTCGKEQSGIEFKWRVVKDNRADPGNGSSLPPCPTFVKTRPCNPSRGRCESVCTTEIGEKYEVKVIAEKFSAPRDIAFHPTPGYHLGKYSEGRRFPLGNLGDGEAWVLNGYNHSISIVSAVRSKFQTTLSRRDRGYYHYMINATALSFNSVGDSGRNPDRDSFNYWAVCNDNLNTYLDKKEPNYFMGPTLYDSNPREYNTVNRLGEPCKKFEECFFLHSDMLHEAPACVGIAHDPEEKTAFGNVYWAFDSTGNKNNGQLIRFDFQQPHGPRSMDHSIAAVRRYPDVKLYRGNIGMHSGMEVHPTRREIFIVNPGNGTITAVGVDTGSFARIAREEYPIYSNRLPSFDYSIWECAEQRTFASGLMMPSGLALSNDGERLYVAEHDSGRILAYEVSSATLLHTIQTDLSSIEGMAISPNSDTLYFVDSKSNTLNAIVNEKPCDKSYETRLNKEFSDAYDSAMQVFDKEIGQNSFSLYHDNECVVKTVIPNVTYFDQVHNDTGYANNNTDGNGMDRDAYLLANRTDCGYEDELNFDALLLGGFYCHTCLPITNGSMCDDGGICQNVQWSGYTCDNNFRLNSKSMNLFNSSNSFITPESLTLDPQVTYRFDVTGKKRIYLSRHPKERIIIPLPGNPNGSARMGSLLFKPSDMAKKRHEVYLHSSTKSVKLFIDFPCKDRKLAWKNDKTKNCKWVKKNKKRKMKFCEESVLVRFKCPKSCEVC